MPKRPRNRRRSRAPARRTLWDRIGVVGRGAVALAAGVTAITGAVAGVRGLVSSSPDEPTAQIQLSVTTDVPLTDHQPGSARVTVVARSGASTATPAPALGRLVLGSALPALLAQADPATGPDGGESGEETTETTQTGPELPDDEGSGVGEEPGPAGSGALGTGTTISPAQEARCGQQATAGGPDGAVTQPASAPPPESCPPVIGGGERDDSAIQLLRRRQEIQREAEEEFGLDQPCRRDVTAPECPLTKGLAPTVPGADGADPQGRALRKLALARMAARQLVNTKSVRGHDGRRDPLGAVVAYRVRLCGFDDKPLVFVWSLIYASGPRRVPYVWDDRRLAYRLRPRSSACQVVTWKLWAPIPRVRGRFTVELTVAGQGEDTTRRATPFTS